MRLGSDDYVILRCLPGQRDASKLWYQFFVEKLQKLFGATVCKEQPCVLKVERKVAMVMHVDDILFLGEQSWINNVFLPGLEKEFRLTSTVVDRITGGSFEFLKRLHVVEANYEKLTVFSESKYVHTLWERFEKVNGCQRHPAVSRQTDVTMRRLSSCQKTWQLNFALLWAWRCTSVNSVLMCNSVSKLLRRV